MFRKRGQDPGYKVSVARIVYIVFVPVVTSLFLGSAYMFKSWDEDQGTGRAQIISAPAVAVIMVGGLLCTERTCILTGF